MGMIEEIIGNAVPGSRVLRMWPLKGGMAAEMTAVEIQEQDGRSRTLVVRRPGSYEEFKILQLIQALSLPSPSPCYWDESGCLVTAFAAGEMDFGPEDVDGYGRQMAAALARIHAADFSTFDVSFLRRREGVCVEFGRTRPFMDRDGLVGGLDVGRMEAVLAKGPPGNGSQVCLIHGDFWAGNMLWLFGVEAVEAFTGYYQAQADVDFTNLPYWDLCAALRLLRLVKGDWNWLVDFAADYGRGDLTAESIRQSYQAFVGRALSEAKVSLRKVALRGN